MKKTYFIIIILILVGKVYSQNREAEKLKFYDTKKSNYFSFNVDSSAFKQNSFMLGWQWDGHTRMSQALKMNCNTYHVDYDWRSAFNDQPHDQPLNAIWQLEDGSHGGQRMPYGLAAGYIYNPALLIDTNNNYLIKILYI